MANQYIIDPSNARAATLGLAPGVNYYKCRMVKDGPYLPVKTSVIEHRDESGDLIGEPLDEAGYRTLAADSEWCQAKYGARPGEKPDLRTIPFVEP